MDGDGYTLHSLCFLSVIQHAFKQSSYHSSQDAVLQAMMPGCLYALHSPSPGFKSYANMPRDLDKIIWSWWSNLEEWSSINWLHVIWSALLLQGVAGLFSNESSIFAATYLSAWWYVVIQGLNESSTEIKEGQKESGSSTLERGMMYGSKRAGQQQ